MRSAWSSKAGVAAVIQFTRIRLIQYTSLFVWLVADGWGWFVLTEKYCWLVADG
jgi:hypothetical protein